MGSGGSSARSAARAWLLAGLAATLCAAVLATLLVPRYDTVGPIDAVVVLGGGAGERLALGRELARTHDVPLVLSAEAVALGAAEGLACEVEIVCLRPEPVSTAGEARTTRELADARGWDRIAVATSSFHVNRARMLFAQCHGDRVDVVGAPADGDVLADVYRYGREALARIVGVTVRRAC